MTTREDVEAFLNNFKIKLEIFGIIFRSRTSDKNEKTLALLDITPLERMNVIKKIRVTDYVEGPIPDELYKGTDLWVFGKDIKKQEVYIKITMGTESNPTICISFHVAEHPLTYPLRNDKK